MRFPRAKGSVSHAGRPVGHSLKRTVAAADLIPGRRCLTGVGIYMDRQDGERGGADLTPWPPLHRRAIERGCGFPLARE